MTHLIQSLSSANEIEAREQFKKLFDHSLIVEDEKMDNLVLYMKRKNISDLLYKHHLYEKIINVNGVIMEFGVRWGKNMALFSALRGIYEPYNYTRKIVGFDTFEGFATISEKDGNEDFIKVGAYSVTDGYEEYLNKILHFHELDSPISHIQKYELVKGDATQTLMEYLQRNPQTIIAFAYFDFDVYTPTKECLQLVMKHVTKGSVIAFDELNHPSFPGETLALQDVLGLAKYPIQRTPLSPYGSYIVIE